MVKLHLGCGERYLDGYVNVDFPTTEHSVQATSPADLHADITRLEYPPQGVDEIRLHHVFEHFDRPTALRLLIDWRIWLKPGGKLVIETPDFERSARAFLRATRLGRRGGVQLRHIFGSHEAPWAVHRDGWYEARYRRTLAALAYDRPRFERSRWRGTRNITVSATVSSVAPSRDDLLRTGERLLRDSLVDDSASELRQHALWVAAMRD